MQIVRGGAERMVMWANGPDWLVVAWIFFFVDFRESRINKHFCIYYLSYTALPALQHPKEQYSS
jgi:hypothetical protein